MASSNKDQGAMPTPELLIQATLPFDPLPLEPGQIADGDGFDDILGDGFAAEMNGLNTFAASQPTEHVSLFDLALAYYNSQYPETFGQPEPGQPPTKYSIQDLLDHTAARHATPPVEEPAINMSLFGPDSHHPFHRETAGETIEPLEEPAGMEPSFGTNTHIANNDTACETVERGEASTGTDPSFGEEIQQAIDNTAPRGTAERPNGFTAMEPWEREAPQRTYVDQIAHLRARLPVYDDHTVHLRAPVEPSSSADLFRNEPQHTMHKSRVHETIERLDVPTSADLSTSKDNQDIPPRRPQLMPLHVKTTFDLPTFDTPSSALRIFEGPSHIEPDGYGTIHSTTENNSYLINPVEDLSVNNSLGYIMNHSGTNTLWLQEAAISLITRGDSPPPQSYIPQPHDSPARNTRSRTRAANESPVRNTRSKTRAACREAA